MGAARLQSRAAAKVGRRCESLALKYGSKGSRALLDSACDVRRSSQGPEAARGQRPRRAQAEPPRMPWSHAGLLGREHASPDTQSPPNISCLDCRTHPYAHVFHKLDSKWVEPQTFPDRLLSRRSWRKRTGQSRLALDTVEGDLVPS